MALVRRTGVQGIPKKAVGEWRQSGRKATTGLQGEGRAYVMSTDGKTELHLALRAKLKLGVVRPHILGTHRQRLALYGDGSKHT